MSDYILEVCAPGWRSAVAAVKGGARRIELCSALPLGGLTPSLGLLEQVRETFPDLRIMVLIRPREGDFVYDKDEIKIMERDISMAVRTGADGIVVGGLTFDGNVDTEAMRRFMDCADGTDVTFHRAIDHCQNPLEAIETLKALGCRRVLTSGGAPTAAEGISQIRRMAESAGEGLIVIAGSGINASNVRHIIDATGVKEVHASASEEVKECDAGKVALSACRYRETSSAKVEELLGCL